jgi:hypothetical protein
MFCVSGPVFIGTEGVMSRFLILRSRTHFRRYRGCRVQFSCFALHSPCSMVPRASGLIFMFCASGHVFGGIGGDASIIHVLRSQTRFRRYKKRQVQFSCFALPDSFSAVPRVSYPIFFCCTPKLIFGRFEGVMSHFHVLRSRIVFRVTEGV